MSESTAMPQTEMGLSSFDDSEQHTRKRNRLTLSCNYCKKRKVKCNRERPCSSCVKYNVGDLCAYPEPHWTDTASEEDSGLRIGLKPSFVVAQNNPQRRPASDPPKPAHYHQAFGGSSGKMTTSGASNARSTNSTRGVMSELEMLKMKIKEIENTMLSQKEKRAVSSQSSVAPSVEVQMDPQAPSTHITAPSPSPYSRQGSFSFSPSFHNRLTPSVSGASAFNSIQLPPINWSPIANEFQDKAKVYTRERDDFRFERSNTSLYLGTNPFDDPEEVINFFHDYTPKLVKVPWKRLNFGIFSWLTLARKDTALRCLWGYLESKVPKEVLKQKLWKGIEPDSISSPSVTDPFKAKTDISETEQVFKNKALNRDGDQDMRKYHEMETTQDTDPHPKMSIKMLETPTTKSQMNKDGLSLGLTMFEGSIEDELKLAEKIIAILPSQRIIWTHINKFFVYVYPFIPFFDEMSFKLEMTRLIGPEDYADKKILKLNVEKRLDFAHVGIMLLMLRFSYLSLFSNKKEVNEYNLANNDPSPKAQELKLLLSNPIDIDVVGMAQLCIDSFDLLRNANFTVLQLAYLIRLYHMFGPEEGDGADGGTAQITNGVLVQIAYSIGVNREPTNFEDSSNESNNNLIRKLWFFLVINDLIQGYQYGNPLVIGENSFDTMLPAYKTGSENIQDARMEKDVISTFAYFEKYYNKLKVVLKLTLNMREGVKIKDLVAALSDFENFIHQTFGDITHYMTPYNHQQFKYTFMKTMKCKNYINLTTFVNSILNHLFLHWEKRDNHHLAFFYMRKILTKLVSEMIPYYLDLFGKNHVNFGEAADLILSPSVLAMMHKTNHMNTAILIRVNALIYEMKKDPQYDRKMTDDNYIARFQKYCRLSKTLERIVKYCITTISKFSNRYYYAWRISKSHSFMFRLVISESFYQSSDLLTLPNFMKHVSTEQLEDICSLYQATWDTISMKKTENEEPKTTGINETPMSDLANQIPNMGDLESVNIPTTVSGYTPVTDASDSDYNRFVNNKDIDRLWLQMISHKQEDNQEQVDPFEYNTGGVFSPPGDFDAAFFTPSNPYLDSLGA